ncbi:hypothetical protein [Mesorhizobium sp. IMUNJ 23232]|uniref:hypothetical protein n=1 Tax=Mesorhizobium sp. IMUNJ 23232 TaxID=3376064 RepID=UPI0037A7FE41
MAKQPFITISNLVEYATTSSAARRRGIIEQYHHPQIYPFNWHGASEAIFSGRACGSPGIEEFIDSEKSRLKSLRTGDVDKDKRLQHVLELVELLQVSDISKVVAGAIPQSTADLPQDLVLEGLVVRIRPNLKLSRAKEGKRFREIGIVKCHQLTSQNLDENSAKVYAVALHMYAETVLKDSDIQPDLCRVYDLYADKLYKAPSSQKRLRTRLSDTAQEICDRWDIIGERMGERKSRPRKAS